MQCRPWMEVNDCYKRYYWHNNVNILNTTELYT